MANNQAQKKPKTFLGVNWSTKVRSGAFWTGTIPALATFLVSIGSLLGIANIEDVVNQGTAIAGVIISLLTQLGVIADPNTKGFKDSGITKTYTRPRDENKDPVEFTAENELNREDLGIFTPEEYTNPEPDTDDSDEVLAVEDEVDGGSAPTEEEELENIETNGKVFAEEEVK